MLLKVQGRTTLERIVRVVAMLVVVALVVWAYWQNNQRIVERLNRDKAVVDETGVLAKPQLDFVQEFRRGLKAEYGVDSRVRIFKDEVEVPDDLRGRLFIGFSPKTGRLSLEMPPLVLRALGEDYRTSRERNWFTGRTDEADWPPRFRDLLIDIWTQLAGIGGEGGSARPSQPPVGSSSGAAETQPEGGEAVRAPVAAPEPGPAAP